VVGPPWGGPPYVVPDGLAAAPWLGWGWPPLGPWPAAGFPPVVGYPAGLFPPVGGYPAAFGAFVGVVTAFGLTGAPIGTGFAPPVVVGSGGGVVGFSITTTPAGLFGSIGAA